MIIPALGRFASIGDFYDIRRDDFTGISAFQRKIPKPAIKRNDKGGTEFEFIHSDSISEKFEKMKIKAELQLSILAGLVSLEGSGQFLMDQHKSSRVVRSSMIYNIRTKIDELNINHEELKPAFALQAFQNDFATHLVTGIIWGASSVVTCQYENSDNRDVQEIQGKLSAEVKKLKLAVSGEAEASVSQLDHAADLSFNIRMHGDMLTQDEELPTTFEGALELMKKLPTLVQSSNQGRGNPVFFMLLPISVIRELLSIPLPLDTFIVRLDSEIIKRVVQLFDEMSSSNQQVHDFYKDVSKYALSLPAEQVREVKRFRNEMQVLESKLRDQLSQALVNVRCGKEPVEKLSEISENFSNSDLSSDKLALRLESWDSLTTKIEFMETLTQAGVKIISKNSALRNQLVRCADNNVYVLYHSDSAHGDDIKWHKNVFGFLKLVKAQETRNRFFAIDIDINKRSFRYVNNFIFVEQYTKGYLTNKDVFGNEVSEHNAIPFPYKCSELVWYPGDSSETFIDVPQHAVCAGRDHNGHSLYVCRVNVHNTLVIGSLVVTDNSRKAYAPLLGKVHFGEEYEILLCPNWKYKWVEIPDDRVIPPNAIAGGLDTSGRVLFIGRCIWLGAVAVGKVDYTGAFMIIGVGNTEVRTEHPDFEVLTAYH